MRTLARGLSFLLAAGVAVECSGTGPTTGPAAAGTKAAAMRSGGAGVLRVTVPADAKFAATDGSLHVALPHGDVEVWLMGGAKTVGEAVGRVGPAIADEFKDFKPDHTTDLTIAGSSAKRLVGPGHEADDGDDGAADVIVFTVGGHVFVACYHGEHLDPAGQAGLLSLVQTAQAP